MNTPKCFASKAFWVLTPIIITSLTSAAFAIDAEFSAQEERLRQVEMQVAENNVPELKQYIKEEFSDLDDKLDSYEKNQNDRYINLCRLLDGNC